MRIVLNRPLVPWSITSCIFWPVFSYHYQTEWH